jgi:hypothetical protein
MTDTPALLQEAQALIDAAQNAIDGATAESNQFESNSDGLRRAAAEVGAKREEAATTTRPPPPPASDLVSGVPGGIQKIVIEGDGPLKARSAARAVSELRARQNAEIAQIDDGLARGGYDWSDLLEGRVTPVSRNPGDVQRSDAAPASPPQPSEADRQKAELARIQQQTEQERQQYESVRQSRAASEDARRMANLVQAGIAEFTQKYPEIRTESDLAAVRAKNPQRAAAAERDVGLLNGGLLQMEALQQRAINKVHAANASVIEQQDRLFAERHPEFVADPKQMAELQRRAWKSLTDKGFADQEIERAWSGQEPLHLRDARVQSYIADRIKLENENAMLKERLGLTQQKLKPLQDLPPVRGPGARQDRDTGSAQRIANLKRAVSKAPTQRAGVERSMDLLQELRKAGKL